MKSAHSPLKIVAAGGGTGLSALLNGLKRYGRPTVDIVAIAAVSDDGGSSGRLRREFDVLPPGDIRNCLVALSEDEDMLARLFQHRFQQGRGLKGHNFGNLFLTALTEITGDFPLAVRYCSEVLAIAGQIFPATTSRVTLEAELEDGTRVAGETRISSSTQPIRRVSLKPSRCRALPEAIQALEEADLITIGPGSLFTSVIPNLLIPDIVRAIRRSLALKACFVNLMSQPGETTAFRASDHLAAILRHAPRLGIDCVVVNTAPLRRDLLRQYALSNSLPVEVDADNLEALGVRLVKADLLRQSEVVRHDPAAVASVALHLAQDGRLRRSIIKTK